MFNVTYISLALFLAENVERLRKFYVCGVDEGRLELRRIRDACSVYHPGSKLTFLTWLVFFCLPIFFVSCVFFLPRENNEGLTYIEGPRRIT